MNWIIKFFGLNYTVSLSKVAIMTTINGLIFASKIIIVGSFITIVLFVFNKFYDLLTTVNTLVSNSDTSSTVSWALQVVASMGVWDAFVDTFAIYSVPLISLIVLFLTKKGLTILESIRQWAEDVTRIDLMGM